ncbi:MAG: cadmium-translocating P-type ATPase [Proteobacteria bacterium]|nr:cadmium-translocating P-type ATPase [Pseudomonadota bacterium]NOG61587.1 cadmium-translocating P-type ATPase [Pseudomonadota bacterium]
MQNNCFHCGEPVSNGLNLFIEIDKQPQAMCCLGCKAVAEQIISSGLGDYYRHRTELPEKPESLVPETLQKLTVFNNPQVQSEFVDKNNDASKEAKLIIEGISCPACVWLIESRITKLEGVVQVSVNYSTQRCRIIWQEKLINLSDILIAIIKLGYKALPYNHKQREQLYEIERKSQLIRLGIAGLFGMQVMMIAIALYFGEVSGIEKPYKFFFYWVSLLLTLPVLLFSGQILFLGAYRDIKNKHPGMDIPITLGISIAFVASVWATINQAGHVYYDSIVMFIFFILGGRYFEFISRKKSIAHLDKITSLLPAYATRIDLQGKTETIELSRLHIADKVIVKPGEVIPVDGEVIEGHSSVNESIITGESLPTSKSIGMKVIGGSTNIESPLIIEVKNIGEKTILSNIARIIDKASHNKAATVLIADKVVSLFIIFVLTIATLVAFYWYQHDQSQWLAITIAVLVVSCPCALSLATPTAMSSAATTLMQYGIAIINKDAIEILDKTNCFVFDKTGTLTEGNLKLEHIDICNTGFTKNDVLQIAASLESASEHPLAKAIDKAADHIKSKSAQQLKNYPGQGITGKIDEAAWIIGTENFIAHHCSEKIKSVNSSTLRQVILANTTSIVARFYFTDPVRNSSYSLVKYLKQAKNKIVLMSGDHNSVVKQVAHELTIEEYQAELKPEDKLNNIVKLQEQGLKVCMIGDGINDAPAFAQADIAIAMTEASDLTKLNADMLLLNHKIETLITMLKIANKTNQTIRMNFTWAIGYNLIALPFAIIGFLAPWMAALGMSLSSLVVVLNATRINTADYS